MSNKPLMNQQAEYSVLLSILKHPESMAVFKALVPSDFTHPTFAEIFGVMKGLAESGRPINEATVNWNPPEEEMMRHGHDWENEWAALVAVIKEDRLRDDLGAALYGDAAIEKWTGKTTPALVLEASNKAKAAKAESDKWQGYIERYVPSLASKPIAWETLLLESDIMKQQGTAVDYIVDEIIPKHRVTMLFGQEKSGKSIVALDLCKHIANGKAWLNRNTVKTPCIYIDLEDGILGAYIAWVQPTGPEEIRFITLRSENGIPALDNSGLLEICKKVEPVIVLDSLHKLFTREKSRPGASAWNSADYEPVLERIRQLCVSGATVILIHHSTKADEEQYRDSSAIGANVDFLFAVVGDEPENGVKRIHLKGQPSRGAQPPTIHILAFPHIIEHGHLCVDAGLEKEDDMALRAVAEIEANGPAETKRALLKRLKGRAETKLAAIDGAIKQGWLVLSESGEINIGAQRPIFAGETAGKRPFGNSVGNDFGNGQF